MSTLRAAPLHAAMRAQVDQQLLPCVSTALLRGPEVVDTFCYGMADREADIALREDHIFRAFSNTKLVTSCAMLLLWEERRFQLDDPIERHVPELGNRQVLRPQACSIDDTEPARSSITVRQLMTHTAGFSYSSFDPGSVLAKAYTAVKLRQPSKPMKDFIAALAPLPLAFHPGTRWEYSIATDVLGHLVEVLSGERLGAFMARRIFEPLRMADTDFAVPASKADRFTALYVGADAADPTKPGLTRADTLPYEGAYLERAAFESGGGGLVTTLGDTVKLLQSLVPGGPALLKPATIEMIATNQLPAGMGISVANLPPLPGRGFSLGAAVASTAGPLDPEQVPGEVNWGGMGGTDWWFNPRLNIAGVLMTQRFLGAMGPHTAIFRREAYRALGH
ncbi:MULTISPECIES: serine hydrolase domain-containing protein [unclassified Variovorax]|uniref:serine hydrolase domain-containing protein n=1 Tax=unclassified Variovorax TaxID=663243 RepID=UPI003F4887D6